MNKSPYLNAVLAALYIVLLVSGLFQMDGAGGQEPNILYPIIGLSFFVLSAAVMGYLFVLKPAMMYVDGRKKEAVDFFLKTVATFAGICISFLIVLLLTR